MNLNRITRFAIAYHRRGWQVIPIQYRKKSPKDKDWVKLRLGERDIIERFNTDTQTNIGVLMGQASKLIDIDLDSVEAVKLATAMLPPTDCRFGRLGQPCTHFLYTGNLNGERSSRLKGPAGDSLVEFRSDGAQTLLPPSMHDNGVEVVFASRESPSHVDIKELHEAFRELGAAALLLRCYPSQGSRHEYALAIAGGLLRSSWTVERVQRFIEAIVTAAEDEEIEDRVAAVGTTKAAIMDGREVTGWPTVSEIIDGSEPKQQFVARIRRHLGIDRKQAPSAPTAAPPARRAATETATTEPYESHRASLDAVNQMASQARDLRDGASDLAVMVSIWLDRKGPETLDVDFPVPYVSKALGISRGHLHKLGQIGRVRRCRTACDRSLALSDRAILPFARLLESRPEAIPEAIKAAGEIAKAEADGDKPKPVSKRHAAAAVDKIIGPAPKHTPVRRRPSPDPDTAACQGVREQISLMADAAASIGTLIPADVKMLIDELAKHKWCRQ